MKKLLVLSLFVCMSAHALQFRSMGKKAKSGRSVSVAEFTKAWDKGIVCVKQGSKLVQKNDNFRKLNLAYSDCSLSGGQDAVHEAMGFHVEVYRLKSLPQAIIKQIKGIK